MTSSKTLVFGALAAIAAVSLFILTQSETEGPGSGQGSEEAAPSKDSAAARSTGVDMLAMGNRRSQLKEATTWTWTVTVIDEGGVSIQDAQIAAVHRAHPRLETVGDAAWQDVAAGEWTLSVQAEGRPLWRREVIVEAGSDTTTRVQIGRGVVLDGRVRNTVGDVCAGRIVGFVPDGARSPELPALWLRLPHTRTGADGRFRMILPKAGNWRLFVGWGGKVAFEDGRPVSLAPGGLSSVEVTVPTPTRLTAIVSDPPGMAGGLAHGFTVYRRADLLAMERPAERPGRLRPTANVEAMETEEDVAEREAQEKAEVTKVDEKARLLRMAVVPPGFAKSKSGSCSALGRITFEDLPIDESLRFAVSRGQEAFAVDGEAILTPGAQVVVRLALPSPLPPGSPALTAPRRVLASIEYPVDAGGVDPVGAIWR